MSGLSPVIASCVCALSYIVGVVVGFGAAFIIVKRSKEIKRLKNIHRVAQNLFDGKYDDGLLQVPWTCPQLTALSFILCESDLSLPEDGKRKG